MTLKIGLDYDDTVTKNPEMFSKIVDVFKSYDAEVHIVTARQPNGWDDQLRKFSSIVDSVVFTGGTAKQDIAVIDIWIDDFPLAITHTFKETRFVPGDTIMDQWLV